jgi:hypothetical protein
MPLQQHLAAPDTTTEEGQRFDGMLVALGAALERKFAAYAGARTEKEAEWERSIVQYNGDWDRADLEKLEEALSMMDSRGDPISVNITRPKTNIAISRMKDIQFPSGGDFNFFIRPAPLSDGIQAALKMEEVPPEMAQEAQQAGIPPEEMPPPAAMASQAIEENREAAPKMERQLRNRLVRADYGTKARLAIADLCIKGTAVVKGPTIQHAKKKRYVTEQTQEGATVHLLEEYFMPEPGMSRVDPLLFYPDPSARLPNEIEDCYELHGMSASDLIELSKNPAFMSKQIQRALEDEPDSTDVPTVIQRTSYGYGGKVHNRYWVREYHGPLDKQVLFDGELISEEDFEDSLFQPKGEVWVCGGHIIRISLSHIEGVETLPYGVAVWEADSRSVFGHGVPYLLRDAQRVVNNAYLMLLDNASLTAGPQIVLNKEMIEPAGSEDYGIAPMKVWFLTEFGTSVQDAMQFVNIPAQMEGIQNIIDTAMQFADVESSTPLLQQGEVPVGNNTTTGLAMIMSATNIIQKAASMSWDDYITRPLVERFYHYEMQYGEDPSLKGDYEIEIGGATERIEAQMRSQEIERMIGLAGSNPEFMIHVDAGKAFRELVNNTRAGDVLRSQSEVENLMAQQQQAAQQEAEQNPELMKAKAALMQAEAKLQEAQANAQLNNARQEMQVLEVQARYEGFRAEAQARNNEANLQYQLGLARLAAEREQSVTELKKDLQLSANNEELKLRLADMDFQKQEREIQVKAEYGSGL